MIDPRLIPDLSRWYSPAKGSLLTGCYYQASPISATSTNNTLGNGVLRVAPFVVPRGVTLSQIGMEVTAVGDTGCVLRLGIYKDNGNGFPGDLLLDAGTVPGDAIATYVSIAITQILRTGVYWMGAVLQGVTTTQPTVRSIGPGGNVGVAMCVPLTNGGSAPGANAAINVGWSKSSVTGALPATWGTTVSPTSTAARIIVKIA